MEEAIALAATLAPELGLDPAKYYGRAFESYGKLPGRGGRMLATRAMVGCALFQTATGRCGARARWLCFCLCVCGGGGDCLGVPRLPLGPRPCRPR